MNTAEFATTEFFEGNKTTVTLPSGKEVTIREPNGFDDEVLSRHGNLVSGDSATMYLAGLICRPDKKGTPYTELQPWLLNDLNYLFLKQRILNHGPILKFKHICANPTCKHHKNKLEIEVEVDLQESFDGDLSDPNYKPTGKKVKRYPNGESTEAEYKTDSGKLFKFKLLTAELEKKRLDLVEDDTNINTPLFIRELQFKNAKGEWEILVQLRSFSSRELGRLRNHIKEVDELFMPLVEWNCPTCQQPYAQQLFLIPDFFWPTE